MLAVQHPVLVEFLWPQLEGGDSNSTKFKSLYCGGAQTEELSGPFDCKIFSKQRTSRKNLLLICRQIYPVYVLWDVQVLPEVVYSMRKSSSQVLVVNRLSLNLHVFSCLREITLPEASVSVLLAPP